MEKYYGEKIKAIPMSDVEDWTNSNLDTLNKWSENVIGKLPYAGSMISDELYLQSNAIQIGIISQLEYFLKSHNKITNQYEILNVIKNSSLDDLEKDHLAFLFIVRHTLVHNGGHCDSKFFEDCKKHITKLKIENYKEGVLSSLSPDNLPLYIKWVKKLIEEIDGQKNLVK